MKLLITGGTGYIGSHTAVELISHGHSVVIIDNLSNSDAGVITRLEALTESNITFYKSDLCIAKELDAIFATEQFDAVLHFAGLKAVGESVQQPLRYYRNNIDATLRLCETMQKYKVKNLVFSSSATVYDPTEPLPWSEASRTGSGITNPYGQTKYMIEQILNDIAGADPDWRISILRYFNPIGAHSSGQIGESPHSIPNNLLPYIAMVASDQLSTVQVFGNDYGTPDGTGVRDYIHVVDLAQGHVAALEHLARQTKSVELYNLGTGKGTSVLELIQAYRRASGKPIPYTVVERRPGDIGCFYADPSKAHKELQWQATKSIETACKDSWNWQLHVIGKH